MNETCAHCGRSADTDYHAFMGDGQLCQQCARIDIFGWLGDCEKSEVAKLRRRAEDRLRKSPGDLQELLVRLIIAGAIDYEDCL